MQPLSLDEFDRRAGEIDRAALASGPHAHFCSSTAWVLPAQAALMPRRQPWLYELEDGFAALMRGMHEQGFRYVEPLEAMWGLACPLLGARTADLGAQFEQLVLARRDQWDVLALSGLVTGSALLRELRDRFARQLVVQQNPSSSRFVASLEGGVDGYLARRSRNFRKGLRRDVRRAAEHGVELDIVADLPADQIDAVYRRILAIEARSWKGAEGTGIVDGPMRSFYRAMLERLADTGRHRLLFARVGDADAAYILGTRFGDTYRGLQFSYTTEHASLALGNVCQMRQIEELCAEGCASYDLGGGLDYKRRWAETEVQSEILLVVNRSR